MLKTERLKKEIEILPKDMLDDVEKFIKNLKAHKKTTKKKSSLLTELAEIAIDVDIPSDFSKQHDHYLYNLPKNRTCK